MVRITYRLLALFAGVFSIGLFAGLLLPAMWLVVMQCFLLILIAFCILCG